MKTETKITLLAYEQPESYEIKIRVRKVICQSQPEGTNTADDGYGNNILDDLD